MKDTVVCEWFAAVCNSKVKNLEILNRKKETQLTKIDDLFCLLGSYFVESTISHM